MKYYYLIIILTGSVIIFVDCVRRKIRSETTEIITRKKGESIAVEYLIRKYELEHQKFYKEEIGEGIRLVWPDLDNKNLSEYCIKYLHHCVPTRTANNVNGTQILSTLYYDKVNTNIASKIVVVQCKIIYRSHTLIYYVTRAVEPNCVYALNCTKNWKHHVFTIINKHCNFEDKPFNKPLKQKREEMISKIHRETGQPIAKDKYLLEYELEHQAFFKKEGNEGKHTQWPHVTRDYSLDNYCYEYMKECAPRRNRLGIKGSWSTEKLCYQRLNTNEKNYITVVQCQIDNARKINYLVTRAPESNCAYALLRQCARNFGPMMIVFKYCDFEDVNFQQTIKQDYNRLDNNVMIPKTETKEETFDTSEILPLFRNE